MGEEERIVGVGVVWWGGDWCDCFKGGKDVGFDVDGFGEVGCVVCVEDYESFMVWVVGLFFWSCWSGGEWYEKFVDGWDLEYLEVWYGCW